MGTITDKRAEEVREFLAAHSADVSTSGLRAGPTIWAALARSVRVRGAAGPPRALAIGRTEGNPVLLWAPAVRPHIAPVLAPWRERVLALGPDFLRIYVNWSQVQPRADQPPRWDAAQSGCQRAEPPCVPYPGLPRELAAIAAQQRTA